MPQQGENRRQRRAGAVKAAKLPQTARLASNLVVHGVIRTIDMAQVAIEIKNTASFPISCILQSAETEIAGLTPPRSSFPKQATTIQPGGIVRIGDERINMGRLPCGRLTGKMNICIKYGLPGKEKFEMRQIADIDIMMDRYGLITAVMAGYKS